MFCFVRTPPLNRCLFIRINAKCNHQNASFSPEFHLPLFLLFISFFLLHLSLKKAVKHLLVCEYFTTLTGHLVISPSRLMLGRGVKRKWSCLEDHLQQRQRVLGLCLEKLQRYQVGVELSLRRSVLLINTLRQIQEDMQSDGVGACTSGVLLNGVHSNSCILREDLPVTCPGSPDQPKSLPAATINAFSDAVNAMGYLSDLALDDIFEDIDTSMYETSDLPSAWASVSVSLWADEDVKMRSSSHASAGSLQSCLTDLNELDHIMEILVKS
uniref:Si:dkey-177p2.6 n=1 Tax=Labrus bergylta TaxID=56723 RepID=A0A3Q3EMA5_9LABR